MYDNFIDKYSDLKRAYVNLMKDSKRIYGEYDEVSLKLAKQLLKLIDLNVKTKN